MKKKNIKIISVCFSSLFLVVFMVVASAEEQALQAIPLQELEQTVSPQIVNQSIKNGTVQETKAPLPVDNVQQIIVGLFSVLTLIFILYFIMKKMPGLKVMGNPHMKVLSVMGVGTREKLALVQVGERVFLLGITQHNIAYLHEFATADMLTPPGTSLNENSATFQSMMQKIFEKRPS